jgi:integral membrane protein
MSRPDNREDDLVPTQPSPPVQDSQIAPARVALGRYRVMAYVTGGWLLLLTLEVVLQWVVDVNGDHAHVIGWWVGFVHGWVFVVYVLTVFLLWTKMRWGLGRLVAMVLAGVVPFMSFVLERRVHRDALAELGDPVSRTTLAP